MTSRSYHRGFSIAFVDRLARRRNAVHWSDFSFTKARLAGMEPRLLADPEHWGRGLAGEAVSRAIQVAFEAMKISALHAGVALWNQASTSTVKRLGFHLTGNNPAGYVVAGTPEPGQEFELTLQQWQGHA
jgi:hypothetical protein